MSRFTPAGGGIASASAPLSSPSISRVTITANTFEQLNTSSFRWFRLRAPDGQLKIKHHLDGDELVLSYGESYEVPPLLVSTSEIYVASTTNTTIIMEGWT